MPRHSLLIVDDEPNVISALRRALYNEDCEIFSANGGMEGLDILASNPIQLVVSDEMMPGMSGAEFLAEVKKRHPDTIRFMLTGQTSIEAAMKAINKGEIYRFFTKPWDDVELIFAIRSAFEKYDLEAENRRLLETVKKQAVELKLLEKQFPKISQLRRDEQGTIVIEDMTAEELAEIVLQCEREYIGDDE